MRNSPAGTNKGGGKQERWLWGWVLAPGSGGYCSACVCKISLHVCGEGQNCNVMKYTIY
jgi:hypothetical protein